jgi:hypothetical protein
MFGLGKIQFALILFAGLSVAALGVYGYGYVSGVSKARVQQLEKSVEAYKTRQKVNNEVQTTDDYSVCLALGGLPVECGELRGLGKTSKSK